jgi:hypothetical protein
MASVTLVAGKKMVTAMNVTVDTVGEMLTRNGESRLEAGLAMMEMLLDPSKSDVKVDVDFFSGVIMTDTIRYDPRIGSFIYILSTESL